LSSEFQPDPTLTALENVMLPLRYEKEANPKTSPLRRWRRSDSPSGSISLQRAFWWRQQRVAIARALVLKPSIILADEPTGELDSTNSEAIIALLKQLNKDECQTCRTFVLVTHDPGIAAQTEQTLIMKDGALDEVASLG
jgi:putative ABC transport system ATP-binding protein